MVPSIVFSPHWNDGVLLVSCVELQNQRTFDTFLKGWPAGSNGAGGTAVVSSSVASSKIEKDTAYLRLINFGAEAIELELFAYFQTSDADEFRLLRETFLLELATLIESAGSALTPTKFIQLDGAAPLEPAS